MTVMVIAIMAIVAAFSSGMVALNRASRASTAATLADIQMEAFRKMPYASIVPTCAAGTSAADDCFSTVHTRRRPGPTDGPTGSIRRFAFDCAVGTLGGTVPTPATCTGTGDARPVKRVTIVVVATRATPAKELFRETSTFDQATG